jgi:ribosomal protein S18 acetylase RimI-like enzyme
VVSAVLAGPGDDATALVFEYMAATQAETGQLVPAGIAELPAVLRRECSDLPAAYCPPGALLIAYAGGQPAGCVGVAARPGGRTAEVKRLYVRPAYRRRGLARTLMRHAHHHAAQHGISQLVLDVLPDRIAVAGFYQRLGYTQTWPHAGGSPLPMISMQRPVSNDDLLPSQGF